MARSAAYESRNSHQGEKMDSDIAGVAGGGGVSVSAAATPVLIMGTLALNAGPREQGMENCTSETERHRTRPSSAPRRLLFRPCDPRAPCSVHQGSPTEPVRA